MEPVNKEDISRELPPGRKDCATCCYLYEPMLGPHCSKCRLNDPKQGFSEWEQK